MYTVKRSCELFQPSYQQTEKRKHKGAIANKAFKQERGRLLETKSALSMPAKQDAIQRLQNHNLREEGGLLDYVLATRSERPTTKERLHKLKNEGLPGSGLAAAHAERLQAGRSKENGGQGNDCKRSKKAMSLNSTAEVLVDGMLAVPNKRLKVENSSENGSAASSCKRPEQGLHVDSSVNKVYSNGVLSTIRKRVRANHHGDKVLRFSGVPAEDCRKSQQGSVQQAGHSNNDVFWNDAQATSYMRLHSTDGSSNRFLSKPFPSRSSEQSLRADSYNIKVMRDGVQATGIQAGAGNSRGKDLSQHLQGSYHSSRLLADTPRHEAAASESECLTLQADNGRVNIPSSNHLVGSRGERSEPSLQAGLKMAVNGVQDSGDRSLLATNPSEKLLSGATLLITANCRRAEETQQSNRPPTEVVANGVLTASASTKAVQAGSSATAEAISSGVRAAANDRAAEQRPHVHSSRSEAGAQGGVLKGARRPLSDNSNQGQVLRHDVVLVGHHEPRLQQKQEEKGVVSNGAVVAGNCDDVAAEGKVKSLHLGRATGSGDAAAAALRVASELEWEDELNRSLALLAQWRLPELPADDEDWLVSCNKKQQLQSKRRERWDSQIQIPQVREEAVLLPVVGIHALPYVVLE